jgi:hypothetical protein
VRVAALVSALAVLAGLAATSALSHSQIQPGPHAGQPQYLFSHDAQGGTFTAVKGRPGHYVLSLKGVSPAALYFSDRPYRIVGAVSVGRMLKGLFHKPGESFPNAAVSTVDAKGGQVLMGLELHSAKYDWKKHTLVYTAQRLKQGLLEDRLKGRTDTVLPRVLGHTSLFIDTWINICQMQIVNLSGHSIPVTSTAQNPNGYDTWAGGSAPTSATVSSVASPQIITDLSGFARGCAAQVVFGDATGTVTITLIDPYSGNNLYACTATGAYDCEGPVDLGTSSLNKNFSQLDGDGLQTNYVIDGAGSNVPGIACSSGNSFPNC